MLSHESSGNIVKIESAHGTASKVFLVHMPSSDGKLKRPFTSTHTLMPHHTC